MSASESGQRGGHKGEVPLFESRKRLIRHYVGCLASMATAKRVLNTIPNKGAGYLGR